MARLKHSLTLHMFDDMIETIEFKCDGKVMRTIVGDGNIQGDCLLCGKDFTTTGDWTNKRISRIDNGAS